MKKNLWIWAFAAFSMAACTSEDAPTPEQVVTENDWISPDGQVLVQLSAEGLPTPNVSVGRAAIEGTDIEKLDKLGIFALSSTGNFTTTTNSPVLLNNVRARGKSTTTLDPDLHKDDEGNQLKRISLYSDETKYSTNDGETASIYYYPILSANNYNFYGYYPRQEDTEVTVSTDEIKVRFSDLNGSTDLITGHSDAAPTMKENTLYAGTNETIVVYNDTDLDGYNAKYIRSIKYHNWLMDTEPTNYPTTEVFKKQPFVPNIKFTHRMALLKFYIVANDNQAGAEDEPYNDREKTRELRVFDLTMKEVPTYAQWSVTGNSILWEEYKDLSVQECTEEDLGENYNDVWETKSITNAAGVTENKNTIIPAENKENCFQAGYMLVAPDEEIGTNHQYEVTLSVLAPSSGDAVPTTQTTTLTIPTQFKAGYEYKVYIQLNALQEVNIHATLEKWKEGDDVDVPVE